MLKFPGLQSSKRGIYTVYLLSSSLLSGTGGENTRYAGRRGEKRAEGAVLCCDVIGSERVFGRRGELLFVCASDQYNCPTVC